MVVYNRKVVNHFGVSYATVSRAVKSVEKKDGSGTEIPEIDGSQEAVYVHVDNPDLVARCHDCGK